MMNIIRADIYRITRTGGIHMNFIFTAFGAISVIVLAIIFGGNENVPEINGVTSTVLLFNLSHFALVSVLPIFTLTAAPIFRNNTAKNEVIWGISRTTLYTSRMLITAILCIMVRIIFVGTGILTATIIRGFGDVPVGFWSEFFQIFTAQTFMFVAASWVGIFIVFTIQNGFVVIEVFGGLMFFPMLLSQTLEMINVNPAIINFIQRFDMMEGIVQLANLGELSTQAILLILALGVFWLIVPTVLGIATFQKAEIK